MTSLSRWLATAAMPLALGLAASSAHAQKAADTLRIAYSDPISTVDVMIDPKPETALTEAAVFDGLVWYDPESGQYKPDIAESWTRPNDHTIDFKIRKGITFHDGSPLTVDDVVYTFNYLADPKSKLRFRTVSFVDHAEKLDDNTVRIVEKRPTSFDLAKLDVGIYPKAIHGKLADKSDYGRKFPIAAGPYKVVYVDPTKGILLERYDGYKSPGPWRPKASIAKIRILPVPDEQTQIAELMVGDLDMIHDVPKDLVEQLRSNPDIAITAMPGPNYFYMSMDAAGRTTNKALRDPRVRQAMEMAINRPLLAREVVTGGAAVKVIDTLCVPGQSECPRTLDVKPPPYDPAGAKKLLAEAGYPNGFDVDMTSIPGAGDIADAVAGELRKIGVKASVAHLTIGAYRKKQASGKQELLVSDFWSRGASPASSFENFFTMTPRDYTHDPEMMKFYDRAAAEFDPAKQVAIWRQAFDRMLSNYTVLPLTTFPTVLAHKKDISIGGAGIMNPGGVDLDRVSWK